MIPAQASEPGDGEEGYALKQGRGGLGAEHVGSILDDHARASFFELEDLVTIIAIGECIEFQAESIARPDARILDQAIDARDPVVRR